MNYNDFYSDLNHKIMGRYDILNLFLYDNSYKEIDSDIIISDNVICSGCNNNKHIFNLMTPFNKRINMFKTIGKTETFLGWDNIFYLLDIDKEKFLEKLKHFVWSKNFRDKNFNFVGFGGIGHNIFTMLEDICISYDIFIYYENSNDKNIYNIYDDDDIELHNFIRYFNKFDIFNSFMYKNSDDFSKFNLKNVSLAYPIFSKLNKSNMRENSIYIGTPDIHTRKLLNDNDIHFITITHHNNDIYIYKNMEVYGIESENYGKINVPIFFLNLVKAIDKLLDILMDIVYNDNTTFYKDKNKCYLEYNFIKDKCKIYDNFEKYNVYRFDIKDYNYSILSNKKK